MSNKTPSKSNSNEPVPMGGAASFLCVLGFGLGVYSLVVLASGDLIKAIGILILSAFSFFLTAFAYLAGSNRPREAAEADPEPSAPPPEPLWRYRPVPRNKQVDCAGCSETLYPEVVAGKRDDRPEVFCESCARMRFLADDLGVEGVGDEYAAGRLSAEQRDVMLDWLIVTNPDD